MRKTRGSRASASRSAARTRLAVGRASRVTAGPRSRRRPRVRSSTGSHVPASAKRDRGLRSPRSISTSQSPRSSAAPTCRLRGAATSGAIGSRSFHCSTSSFVAVELRVEHRVRAEAIGAELEEARAPRRARTAATASRAASLRPRARPCRRRLGRGIAVARALHDRCSAAPARGRAPCPSRRGCSRTGRAPAASTAPPGSSTRGTRPRPPRRRRRSTR